MKVLFSKRAAEEYRYWEKTDRRVWERINRLLHDIQRDPFSGIGKPEPLKHELAGCWSRRITGVIAWFTPSSTAKSSWCSVVTITDGADILKYIWEDCMRWLFVGLWGLFKPQARLIAENLCLRQQLAVLRRQQKLLKLQNKDWRFWILICRWFTGWQECLVIVTPATVLRWHEQGYRA